MTCQYPDATGLLLDIDDIVLITNDALPTNGENALIVGLGSEDDMEVIVVRYGRQNHVHFLHPSNVTYTGICTGPGGHK